MGGAEGGNGPAGLGPCGGEFGVGVNHAADGREGPVKLQMRLQIGGGLETAGDDFAFKIAEDYILGGHLLVRNAASSLCNSRSGKPSVIRSSSSRHHCANSGCRRA